MEGLFISKLPTQLDMIIRCEEALFQYIILTSAHSKTLLDKVQKARKNWLSDLVWNSFTPVEQSMEYLNIHMMCLVEEAEKQLIEKVVSEDFVHHVDLLKNLSLHVCNHVLDKRYHIRASSSSSAKALVVVDNTKAKAKAKALVEDNTKAKVIDKFNDRKPSKEYWDSKPITYESAKMRMWCDTAFSMLSKKGCTQEAVHEYENDATGIFLGKWMEDLITKQLSLHCDQACYDIARHFVSLRFTQVHLHVDVQMEEYNALAMMLKNFEN